MFTNNFVVTKANELNTMVTENLAKQEDEDVSIITKLVGTADIDAGVKSLNLVVQSIASAYRVAIVDGIGFPEFLTNINVGKSDLSEVDITIKAKQKAENQFKAKATVKLDDDFVENVASLFTGTLFEEFYKDFARRNVALLNLVLEDIHEEENIPFSVSFAVDNKAGRVVSITNDSIVIKADVAQALDISQLPIMTEARKIDEAGSSEEDADGEDEETLDGYESLVYKEARKAYVDAIRTVQITPEVIKKKIELVEKLGDLHTKRHSNKILRERYHKKAENLNGKNPEEVGYFSQKVEIDGKEADVFALLTKDGDKFNVVLNPYDAETNTAVDFDVISALS